MDDQRTIGGLEVAIENLTSEFRSHRNETREDLKEIRDDLGRIDIRLTKIETQTAITQSIKHQGWERWGIIVGIVGAIASLALVLVEWLKH